MLSGDPFDRYVHVVGVRAKGKSSGEALIVSEVN